MGSITFRVNPDLAKQVAQQIKGSPNVGTGDIKSAADRITQLLIRSVDVDSLNAKEIKLRLDDLAIGNVAKSFVTRIVGEKAADRIAAAEQIIQVTVDDLMSQFWIWVGQNFILTLTSEGSRALSDVGVTWKPLSKDYVDKKAELGFHTGFWIYSQTLYRQFNSRNSRRRGLLQGTSTEGQFKTNGRFNGEIKVNVLQDYFGLNTPLENLMGIGGRDLEAKLLDTDFGGNEGMVMKLEGKQEWYRPLLGPALAYYIKDVIKYRLLAVLQGNGFDARSTNGRS